MLTRVEKLGARMAEVTGGGPLLEEVVPELVTRLCNAGCTVLIETGGHHRISVLGPGRGSEWRLAGLAALDPICQLAEEIRARPHEIAGSEIEARVPDVDGTEDHTRGGAGEDQRSLRDPRVPRFLSLGLWFRRRALTQFDQRVTVR